MDKHDINTRICAVCGREESDTIELFELDGQLCCAACAHTLGYSLCDECGEWFKTNELNVLGGQVLCDECAYDAGWERCAHCGEWTSPDDQICVDRHTSSEAVVCGDCAENDSYYFQCHDCDEYFSNRFRAGRLAGYYAEYVCDDCGENYRTCYECGDLVHEDDAYYSAYRDSYYCADCWDNRESDGDEYIHDYGYKPSPCFFYTDSADCPRSTYSDSQLRELTFGLELEIDKGDDRGGCASEVHDRFDDLVYMKADSSVDFELVTHPCTLDYHRKHFDWPELCAIPPRYGYESHNARTCGLHIHVGRDQLGGTESVRNAVIGKIIMLVYRHWNALVRFSRRTEEQLSRWARSPEPDFSHAFDDNALIKAALSCVDGDRYYALNTCNYDTIEFRLWRGTLKPETVLATIELTSNICRYAMAASVDDVCNSNWENIAYFEHYPELDNYLVERGLTNDEAYSKTGIVRAKLPESLFKVGDHVRIIRSSDYLVCDTAVAERPTGTLIARNSEGRWLMQFDEPHPNYGHTADGMTPNGCGYFVNDSDIGLANATDDDKYAIGTVVELRPSSQYVSYFRDYGITHTRGIIFCIRGDGAYGVYFPDIDFGHSLGGALDVGDTHGWWTAHRDIMPVKDGSCFSA